MFTRNEEQLANLNLGTDEEPRRVGEKNAAKALECIEAARHKPLHTWPIALGLPSVGTVTARELAARHASLAALVQSPLLRDLLQAEASLASYTPLPNE